MTDFLEKLLLSGCLSAPMDENASVRCEVPRAMINGKAFSASRNAKVFIDWFPGLHRHASVRLPRSLVIIQQTSMTLVADVP